MLDPACAVLHYAQEIFEGLKAYRLPDGGAALFRADANARRFRASAERLAMAPLPEDWFLESFARWSAPIATGSRDRGRSALSAPVHDRQRDVPWLCAPPPNISIWSSPRPSEPISRAVRRA
jgi:branched-chain amino acid aminotransferase